MADLIVPVSKNRDRVNHLIGNTIELIKRFIRSQVIESGDKIEWEEMKEEFSQNCGPSVKDSEITKLVIGN